MVAFRQDRPWSRCAGTDHGRATVPAVPPPPLHRPLPGRWARLLAALVAVLLLLPACRPAEPGGVLDRLPAVALDRGVVWQRDAAGLERLLAVLDLPADRLEEAVVSGAPRLVVLAHPDADRAAVALDALGFGPGEVRPRPDQVVEATVGIPAAAVADDLVVLGDPDEVAAVLQAATPDPLVPDGLLSGADVALLGTPATAAAAPALSGEGAVPDHRLHLLTGTADGGGALAVLAEAVTQDDAVALAVRLRTAVLPDGFAVSSLLTTSGPLADGDRIVVDVSWLADPTTTLQQGLVGGLPGIFR